MQAHGFASEGALGPDGSRRARGELPQPVPGDAFTIEGPLTGEVRAYVLGPEGETTAAPLVLVHSVNAAASAFEVRLLFERYARSRPVYALDLPGFGLSERSNRRYTPRLMTDAVLALVSEVRRRHGGVPVDALALSLSSEYLARAASEHPAWFRSVSLVSPTGFRGTKRRAAAPGTTRAVPGMHALLALPLLSNILFGLLTRPAVIRYFLERTWGSKKIDEALWAYDVLATRQPGAKHAPLYFLAAHLFSADISVLYESLDMPVWMSHGVRGDFVDFRGASELLTRPNWSASVFQTGALPHYEEPELFFAAFDAFLAPVDRRS